MLILNKGRKALPVGTIREYGGKKFKRMATGWQYVGRTGKTIGEKKEAVEKKKPTEPVVSKGVYYFKDRNEAKRWAEKNGWPTDRIISYDKGWAVQSGKSGNYAGPGEKSKGWEGTTKHPEKVPKDDWVASGAMLNFISQRHTGSLRGAKESFQIAKRAAGFKTDEEFQAFSMQYGDPDKPGQYENVRKKWLDRVDRLQKESKKGSTKAMKEPGMRLYKVRVVKPSEFLEKSLPKKRQLTLRKGCGKAAGVKAPAKKESAKDEAAWDRAKAEAKKGYPDMSEDDDRYWKIVQKIYENMK